MNNRINQLFWDKIFNDYILPAPTFQQTLRNIPVKEIIDKLSSENIVYEDNQIELFGNAREKLKAVRQEINL